MSSSRVTLPHCRTHRSTRSPSSPPPSSPRATRRTYAHTYWIRPFHHFPQALVDHAPYCVVNPDGKLAPPRTPLTPRRHPRTGRRHAHSGHGLGGGLPPPRAERQEAQREAQAHRDLVVPRTHPRRVRCVVWCACRCMLACVGIRACARCNPCVGHACRLPSCLVPGLACVGCPDSPSLAT